MPSLFLFAHLVLSVSLADLCIYYRGEIDRERTISTSTKRKGDTAMTRNYTNEELQATLQNLGADEELIAFLMERKDTADRYEKETAPYKKLFELIWDCPWAEEMFSCTGIETREATPENLVVFTNFVSNELAFSQYVYNEMWQWHKDNLSPITEGEVALCKAMNSFYRETYGIDWDVFDMTVYEDLNDGKDVFFDQVTMQIWNNPGRVNVYRVSDICVPSRIDDEGRIIDKAIVLEA